MSFVSSPIGVVILGLAIGLLTNVLYVVLDLERAARWLQMRMGAVCTFWWESLWGRVVATRKKPVQWSPDPGDLSRLKAVLDQQYSTYSNPSREDPAAEANKLEGEELDTSTLSSDEVVAYVQLNVPLARAFHEKLVDADGWKQVSETLLQKIEVVGKDFLARAISALQAALENDASSTLQIDGWGLFHCKPDGQIHLLKLEDGVHPVPAIISVSGSDIKGRNLYQAEIQVSTQDSSELLQPLAVEELTGGLHKLFVTIPRLYKKLSGVYITALKSILEGDKELVFRSIATSFLMDPSSGAAGLFPWVCTPSTWILLLVSLCCFTVAVYYYAVHSRSACARDRKRIVEHNVLTSRHQAVLPSRIFDESLLELVYKAALMLSAVILVGAIMKNRLHRRLSFIRRRQDLRLAEADNEPEAVTVDIEPGLLALWKHYTDAASDSSTITRAWALALPASPCGQHGPVTIPASCAQTVSTPGPVMSELLRRVSTRNASLTVATLRPIKSCSETSPRNQFFCSGFRVGRCQSMK